MKKIMYSAFPFLAAAALAFSTINEPLPIGSSLPKPELKMKDITGKMISFNDAMGKNGLLVMFSCNTCPIVHKYQERINEVAKWALEKNIGVILLNPNEAYRTNGDSYEDMQAYAKEHGFSWYYVVDEKSVMADAFGATRTPECFLFSPDKKLVYHGAIDDSQNPANVNRKHLMIAYDEMLAGKNISVSKTKSVGCTIKRIK
jgi:peroxiredoxin